MIKVPSFVPLYVKVNELMDLKDNSRPEFSRENGSNDNLNVVDLYIISSRHKSLGDTRIYQ